MREILFRGQTRRYGEKVRMGDGQKLPSRWVYGGVLQGAGDHSIIYGGENENNPRICMYKWVVYSDTLGQFTGLTDKNGKKIFEGDILKFHKFKGEPDWLGFVRYDISMFVIKGEQPVDNGGFEVQLCSIDRKRCEIIGNIYDNPELLKEGDS